MQEQQGTRRRWRIGDQQPYDVTHVRGEHAVYRFYSDGGKLVWRIVRPDWRGRTDSGALTWPGILAANGFVDEVLPVELPDLVDGQPLDDGGALEDACTEQCPMNVDNVAAGPAAGPVTP